MFIHVHARVADGCRLEGVVEFPLQGLVGVDPPPQRGEFPLGHVTHGGALPLQRSVLRLRNRKPLRALPLLFNRPVAECDVL